MMTDIICCGGLPMLRTQIVGVEWWADRRRGRGQPPETL